MSASNSALALIEAEFDHGKDVYLLPLAMAFGDASEEIQRTAPNAAVAAVESGTAAGLLDDGVFDDQTCTALFSLIENAGELQMRHGRVRGLRGNAFQDVLGSADTPLAVRRSTAEQSNTSILFGDRFILKLFRRPEAGLNPDCEIGRYLTEKTAFDRIPPFAGFIEYVPAADGEPATLAMLQGLVGNEGDGWKWTLEELDRYYETCAPVAFPENLSGELGNPGDLSENPVSQLARDNVGIYLDSAAILGRRTAELHTALAAPSDDPAFAPEPLTPDDIQILLADLRERASGAFEALKESVSQLPDDTFEIAVSLMSRRRRIFDNFGPVKFDGPCGKKIRIHGDYHLGQVLRVKSDFVILDFEGEPARPLSYRRSKQSPLKDVAGMLRSFSYAAYTGLINYTARHPEDVARLEPWARLWESAAAAEFLRAYRETAQGADFLPFANTDFRRLLNIFLMDKAFYEVLYELNSRPAWVRIPLMGILSLMD